MSNPCENHDREHCGCMISKCVCCGEDFWLHEDSLYCDEHAFCTYCRLHCSVAYNHNTYKVKEESTNHKGNS
jgi:hypothetical protein